MKKLNVLKQVLELNEVEQQGTPLIGCADAVVTSEDKKVMKKVYFSKSFKRAAFNASCNFDLMQFVKILTKQGGKNRPIKVKGTDIWSVEISRNEYKKITDLAGVEIVPEFNYLLN